MKSSILLAFVFTAMLPAADASAGFDRAVYALQNRLQIDGYYSDETDGLAGPNFRRALSDYAADHDIAPSASEVFNHIAIKALENEARRPLEQELQEARNSAREKIKDGPAARFRNEIAFDVADRVVICGEINGKNSYGAYIGFTPYQAVLSQLDFDELMEEVKASGETISEEQIEKMREFTENYYISSVLIDSPFTQHLCDLGTSSLIPN